MRTFYLLVLLCSITSISYAQQISGRVILEGRNNATGTVISLESKAGKTIDYQVLHADSSWHLKAKQAGTYYLRAYHLSYQRYDSSIVLKENDSLFISLHLKPNQFELSGVEIIGQRMAIEQRGDTVSYTVDAFKSAGDTKLEDVLQKMPGVEVTDDHQIRYMGKKVDVLLIEGHNVLNNQHQLVAEGVDLEAVRSVEFIQNYRTEMEKGAVGESNQTAMNVKLKKEAKGKTNGDVQGSVGYKNKYEINGNALHYRPKLTYTLFARNNNLTEAVLNTTDYMNLQTSLLDMLNQHKGGNMGQAIDILPTELSLTDDIYKSNDALLAGNWSFKLNDKTKLRSSALLLHTNHQKQFKLQRVFYSDQSIFQGDLNNQQTSYIGDFKTALEHQLDSTKMLGINIEYHHKNKVENETQTIFSFSDRMENETNPIQQIAQDNRHTNLFVKAKLNHQKTEQISLKYGLSYLQKSAQNKYWIESSQRTFAAPKLTQDSLFIYEQRLKSPHKTGNAFVAFHQSHSRFPRIVKLSASWRQEVLKGLVLLPHEYADQQRLTKSMDLLLQQNYTYKKLNFSTSATINYHHLKQGASNFQYPSFNPKIGISYLFNPQESWNKLSLNYGLQTIHTSFNQTNRIPIIQNPQTLVFNTLSFKQLMRKQYANLYLNWTKLQHQLQPFFMLGINYAYSKQATSNRLVFATNHWTQGLLLTPYQKSLTTYFNASLKLSPHIKWQLSTSHIAFKGFYYNVQSYNMLPFNNQTINTQTSLTISLFKKKLSMNPSYQFLHQKNTLSSSLHIHTFKLDTKIALLKKRLLINTQFQYQQVQFESSAPTNWLLSAQATYRLSPKWQILLKSGRMNRFNPINITSFEANNDYSQTNRYTATEAYAITGLKYKF